MTGATIDRLALPTAPERRIDPADPTFDPADPFGPFDRDDFRSDLADLADSARDGWIRWAHECRLIAGLAAQVPRSRFDTRGATPWTSFLREIAVARRCSDQAAANEIQIAALTLKSRTPKATAAIRTPSGRNAPLSDSIASTCLSISPRCASR